MSSLIVIGFVVALYVWILMKNTGVSADVAKKKEQVTSDLKTNTPWLPQDTSQMGNTVSPTITGISKVSKQQRRLSLKSSLVLFVLAMVGLFTLTERPLFWLSLGFSTKAAAVYTVALYCLSFYALVVGIAALLSAYLAFKRINSVMGYKIVTRTIKYGAAVLLVWGIIAYFPVSRRPRPPDYLIYENPDDLDSKNSRLEYIENMSISNISVIVDLQGDDAVGGYINNKGGKAVGEIELTLIALDVNNEPIYETKFNPITDSTVGLVGHYAKYPIAPNSSSSFWYKFTDAPSEWSRKVEIKITDIQFSY